MIDRSKPNLGGNPAAPWRTRLAYAPADPEAAPAVSVVTPAGGSSFALLETFAALRGQSLQAWEWLLLVDPASDPRVLTQLTERAQGDPRVRLLDAPVRRPLGSALRDACRAAAGDWIELLAPYELLEATALEKLLGCVLARQLDWAAGWAATHGERFVLLDGRAAESPAEPVPGRLLVRRTRLAERLAELPDPDRGQLLAGLARADASGAVIPEVLHWIPWSSPGSRRQQPLSPPPPADPQPSLAIPPDRPLFPNALRRRLKRLLLAVPRLSTSGSRSIWGNAIGLLARQGWQLTVVALHPGDEADEASLARITCDVHVLGRSFGPADWPRALRGLVESRRPEVVVLDGARLPSALGRHLRARCPEPRYVALHHADPDDPAEAGPFRPIGADDGAEVLLASEPPPRDADAGAGPLRLWLPLGVDTTVWRPRAGPRSWMRPNWGAGEDDAVLLFAGALGDRSRLGVLVDSLRALRERSAGWIAVIAGEGPERDWLAAEIERHGLTGQVRWAGALSDDLLLRTLAAVDLLFAPSHAGFAALLPRAMAMELPVVAADVGGQRALVTPASGRLVDPGPGEALRYAEALSPLIDDPGLRRELGRHARRQVLLSFGPDRLAQALDDALTTPLAPRAAEVDGAAAYAAAVEQSLAAGAGERARRRAEDLAREAAALAARVHEFEAERQGAADRQRALRGELEQRERELADAGERSASLEEMRAALAAALAREADRADTAAAALADAERRGEVLAESLRVLQRERLAIAGQLGELGRRWWRPRALSRRAADLARSLVRLDGKPSP